MAASRSLRSLARELAYRSLTVLMAEQWSARLDPRGYHATSATRPSDSSLTMRWVGEPEVDPEDDRFLVGNAVDVFIKGAEQPTIRVEIGDTIFLKGISKGKPTEIFIVDELYQRISSSTTWFKGRFFWRPEVLGIADDAGYDWHERELFLASHVNPSENRLDRYLELHKPKVHKLRPTDVLPADLAEPYTFFYRRKVHVKAGEFEDLDIPPAATPATAASATAASDVAASDATTEGVQATATGGTAGATEATAGEAAPAAAVEAADELPRSADEPPAKKRRTIAALEQRLESENAALREELADLRALMRELHAKVALLEDK